jgi:hypothetical protein
MAIIQDIFKIKKVIRSWDKNRPFTCPICGARIIFCHNDGGRLVVFLHGAQWVITNFYKCKRRGCVNQHPFTMAPVVALSNKKFGLDVWEQAIRWHFKIGQNYTEISSQLKEDFKLVVSRDTIRNMCQAFEILGSQEADKETMDLVQKNKRIILSFDGTGDNDGGPGLWIFTDRLSGRALHADVLEHATVDTFGAIIRSIQEKYKVPIVGAMSDRQETIVLAVERYLPGVPHAFCHFHFLENLARPIATKDSALLDTLKKASETFI